MTRRDTALRSSEDRQTILAKARLEQRGLTFAEIAKVLDMPNRVTAQRVFYRAIEKLRKTHPEMEMFLQTDDPAEGQKHGKLRTKRMYENDEPA